jgi:hypothetical protein
MGIASRKSLEVARGEHDLQRAKMNAGQRREPSATVPYVGNTCLLEELDQPVALGL